MPHRKVTGWALIAGATALIFAVGIHPHQGSVGSGENTAARNLSAVTVVLASFGVLGVGFSRLLRSFAAQPWKDVAVIALALAGICGSLAGVIGHLAVPRLVAQMNAAEEPAKAIVDVVIANDSAMSGALAQTSFAAWAVGAICLSISMLRDDAAGKVLGGWGIALGIFILLALGTGRLQVSLHNVGLLVLGSGVWLIAFGVRLLANASLIDRQRRSAGCQEDVDRFRRET